MVPHLIRPAVLLTSPQYELATEIGAARAAAAWALADHPLEPVGCRGCETEIWLADLEDAFNHMTRNAIDDVASEIAVAAFLDRTWGESGTRWPPCPASKGSVDSADVVVRRIGPRELTVEISPVDLAHHQTLVVTSVLEHEQPVVVLWGSLAWPTLMYEVARLGRSGRPIRIPLRELSSLDPLVDVSRDVVHGAAGVPQSERFARDRAAVRGDGTEGSRPW